MNTGFSYADKSLTKMQDGAEEFVNFIESFLDLHFDLRDNDLYLAGESYAGKYLALFTKTILERNDALPASNQLSLKSTIIFDPIASPMIQRTNMHTTPYSLNILD